MEFARFSLSLASETWSSTQLACKKSADFPFHLLVCEHDMMLAGSYEGPITGISGYTEEMYNPPVTPRARSRLANVSPCYLCSGTVVLSSPSAFVYLLGSLHDPTVHDCIQK